MTDGPAEELAAAVGIGLPPRERTEGLRRRFAAHFRTAGRPLVGRGWKPAASSLSIRGADGAWGHIAYSTSLDAGGLRVYLTAGTLSAYLMRALYRVDPDRPPPRHFLASDGPVLLDFVVTYVPAWDEQAAALSLPQPGNTWSDILLGDGTARPWLTDALVGLAAEVELLCSDLAMRDRLVATAGPGSYQNLRLAALLTKHLGRLDELPDILGRAARAKDVSDDEMRAIGIEPVVRDRSTRYPQDWSHERFLSFLAEAPE